MSLSIPSTLFTFVTEWQDLTLRPKSQGGLAEACIVYYPPIQSSVLSPQLMPVGAKTFNLVPTGGDFPAQHNQVDPMQFGQNFVSIDQTETIYMTIQWEPSQFNNKLYPGYRLQDGSIITKGYTTDLQKVKNAEFIEIFQDAGHGHYRFILLGEPVIPGQFTGARYFYALWARQ